MCRLWVDVVNEWRWGLDYNGVQMIHDTQRGLLPHRFAAPADVVRSCEWQHRFQNSEIICFDFLHLAFRCPPWLPMRD